MTPTFSFRLRIAVAIAALAAPGFALGHAGNAHHLHGAWATFCAGLGHPLTGIDHVLAAAVFGVLAARSAGRAPACVPPVFLATMLSAAVGARHGFTLPAVETGIALSLIVAGLALAGIVALTTPMLTAAACLFAAFHGQAHGAELPPSAFIGSYLLGLMLASATLMALGALLGRGRAYASVSSEARPSALHWAGVMVASAGLGHLLVQA